MKYTKLIISAIIISASLFVGCASNQIANEEPSPRSGGVYINSDTTETNVITGNTFITTPPVIISDAKIVIGSKGKLEPFGDALVTNSLIRSYNSLHFDATNTRFENCILDNVVPDNAKSIKDSVIYITNETNGLTLPVDVDNVKIVRK